MTKITYRKDDLHFYMFSSKSRLLAIFALAAVFLFTGFVQFAQESLQDSVNTSSRFRVGEKLTYNVSFGKFKNAAYAETNVVSAGKLADKNAIELQSKIRTSDFVGAAFFLIDESRTTYVSSETGLPLYVRKTSNVGAIPKTSVENYLDSPTANFDLLSLVFQARAISGNGSLQLFEDDRNFIVSLQNIGSERVLTDAGDFETTISSVTSEFFVAIGIKDVKLNFSSDEARVPVLIRLMTDKGEFRAELASARYNEITVAPSATPATVPTTTPSPRPVSTPQPYTDNQPLSSELPFRLGELLEYSVTENGSSVGIVSLEAKERKEFSGSDSLHLKATVTKVDTVKNILNLNDGIAAQVNPETLAPQSIELKFSGSLSQYSQSATFDQITGTVTFSGRTSPDIPVGTHSILSLAYAIRSFNLKPSKDINNPVNDTRVAVFFNERAFVFTLRPSSAEIINFQDQKVGAQMIAITTGDPSFDRLNIRVWLSSDERRVPLRIAAGTYQAELVSSKIVLP